MESREQRIATLATTLRASGIAKSDSQAKMMAEDMIGVEEHVQKNYEVEHARAHEYLQTVKNLGDPRIVQKTESIDSRQSRQDSKLESRSKPQMEELYVSKQKDYPADLPKTRPPEPEHTSINFGTKTLSQAFDHDTHNSALEAIKAEISRKEFKPVDDIVPDSVVPQSMLHEDIEIVNDLPVSNEIAATQVSDPISNSLDSSSSVPLHKDIEIVDVEQPEIKSEMQQTEQHSEESVTMDPLPKSEAILSIQTASEQTEQRSDQTEQILEPLSEQPTILEASESPDVPKLDTQKLIDMMEEDGKLEEHTREIKEKPKDSKPKEAYEENNIDLSHMFDFNKGLVRK